MIAVGILNRNRPIDWVGELIDSSIKQTIEVDHYILSTNQIDKCDESKWPISSDNYLDNTGENIGFSKNRIIQRARDIGVDQLILIEDDIIITRDDTFEHYLDAMAVLKTGILSNGYTNSSNYILTLPSPRTKVILGELCKKLPHVIANRHECGDFLVLDLNVNTVNFSEDLKYFEFSEYIFKCYKADMIPGLNMFLDIADSWTYMKKRPNCKSLRTGDTHSLKKDKNKMDEIIGNSWTIENDLKVVVDWIRRRVGV